MLPNISASVQKAVPRYTSYPTAPHFVSSVGERTYASWLGHLSKSDTVSLYFHVPFCKEICLYCGCHTKATRRFAPVDAYVDVLLKEIDLLADNMGCRRIVHLHWGGGTPSIAGPERLRDLVTQLDVRFDLTSLEEHAFELDPRYVTTELVSALAEIGVTRASLGVQDLSAHVQQAIGRVQPFSIVRNAVSSLREAGIRDINIDLMYGLPNQTVDDIRRSVALVHELEPQRLAVFGYAHVPWLKHHQRLLDQSSLPDSTARFAQAIAAHDTLTALGYEPIGLDHYAAPSDSLAEAVRRRKLHRNFQGYTTDDADALIGCGASAIGRLPQGFVQNAADTAGYSRAITSNRLATVRGLELSLADRARGRVIEELMCHLDCDVGSIADEYNYSQEYFEPALGGLAPFVSDDLVRIEENHIRVNEKGRPYLRLIAAAFDEYLTEARARHSVAV